MDLTLSLRDVNFLCWIFLCHAIVFVASGEVEEDATMAFINLTYIDRAGSFYTEKNEDGMYGDSRVDSVNGLVVHVLSRNRTSNGGCELPFESRFPDEPWIALIRRGECSYLAKTLNAHHEGATAVVIYDSNNRDGELQKMRFRGRAPAIVSVFISQEKGQEIAELVDGGLAVRMYIIKGSKVTVSDSETDHTMVFASILGLIACILMLAILVLTCISRRARPNDSFERMNTWV